MKRARNPYSNTKKRKAALAWMAAEGITQPRPLYPTMRVSDIVDVKIGPLSTAKVLTLRTARII